MHNTCNNCFELKQYNMTLHQVKIGKHESAKIAATYIREENGKI